MLWQQSKDYRSRPSQLMGIDEQPLAYFIDRAVWAFGSRVEAEVRKVQAGDKSERQKEMAGRMVMNRWLGGALFARG
jgi:hypothetical protein